MINTNELKELRIYEVSAQHLWVEGVFSCQVRDKKGVYSDARLRVDNIYNDDHPGVEKGYVWLDVTNEKGRTYSMPLSNNEHVYIRMP